MSELKVCPFCRSNDVAVAERHMFPSRDIYLGVCRSCGSRGKEYGSRSAAGRHWNTRTPVPLPPLVQAVVDASESAFDYHYRVRPWENGPTFSTPSISETEMAVCEAYRKWREAQP